MLLVPPRVQVAGHVEAREGRRWQDPAPDCEGGCQSNIQSFSKVLVGQSA